jgi:hypothetical protein
MDNTFSCSTCMYSTDDVDDWIDHLSTYESYFLQIYSRISRKIKK